MLLAAPRVWRPGLGARFWLEQAKGIEPELRQRPGQPDHLAPAVVVRIDMITVEL
jgi:hypothetical protein